MVSIHSNYIKKRKRRTKVLRGLPVFTRGDVLSINYRMFGLGFVFTGLCLGVNHKSMVSSNTSFCLRNVLGKVPVELNFSLYGLCRVTYKLLDYARKQFYYKSAKLFYLRLKSNKESYIKE